MATDKRYQIFVSSTYIDLIAERNAVIKAILDLGHIPVGMEMFSADNDEQWQTIKREIDKSDYYLIMVAHRYGNTIKDENNISYTEKEFDYAVSSGIPRIGFVLQDGIAWNPDWIEKGHLKKRVDGFKKKIMTRPVSFWTSPEDLMTKVTVAVSKIIVNSPRPGWRRASDEDQQTIHTMNLLTQENMRLRGEVDRLSKLQAPKAELTCSFIDADDKDLGDVLKIRRSQGDLKSRILHKNLQEIQELVRQYDEIVSLNSSRSQLAMHAIVANVDKHLTMPYNFDSTRIDKLLNSLRDNKIIPPGNPLDFADLRYFHFDTLLGYKKSFEPSSGTDLEKYNAFVKIESALDSLHSRTNQELFKMTHEMINIRANNSGSVAIDDIKFEVKFTPAILGTYLGKLEFDHRTHSLDELSRQVDVKFLVPGESSRLGRMIFRIPHDLDEVKCIIKIIGRQLPSAVSSELKIQFYDDNAAE